MRNTQVRATPGYLQAQIKNNVKRSRGVVIETPLPKTLLDEYLKSLKQQRTFSDVLEEYLKEHGYV